MSEVKNSLVRFTISLGDDTLEKSCKELGVREYADRIGLVNKCFLT